MVKPRIVFIGESLGVGGVANTLQAQGFPVSLAQKVSGANLTSDNPSVIVLHVPDDQGIGNLEMIRAAWSNQPVIVILNQRADKSLADRCQQAGAQAILWKPYHPQALLRRIRQVG